MFLSLLPPFSETEMIAHVSGVIVGSHNVGERSSSTASGTKSVPRNY